MDYKEEQAHELEALLSIYPEIDVIEEVPNLVLELNIKAEDSDDREKFSEAKVRFTLPVNYPEVAPEIETEDEALLEAMQDEASSLVGCDTVMIFSLINAAQEHMCKEMEHEKSKMKKLREIEEEELKKKLEGTKVTVESFTKWKEDFDAEMYALNPKEDLTKGKLTGKQMFIRDKALAESDLKFELGDVNVDESLFDDEQLDELE